MVSAASLIRLVRENILEKERDLKLWRNSYWESRVDSMDGCMNRSLSRGGFFPLKC
jgi:hypothetical protein